MFPIFLSKTLKVLGSLVTCMGVGGKGYMDIGSSPCTLTYSFP